ncbi:hypothetical protein C8R47DRAFT_1228742 [Mycena vitilis]|nr:hypothetical protein C8R47DRAFT_1228742 [Mycena vitilis]
MHTRSKTSARKRVPNKASEPSPPSELEREPAGISRQSPGAAHDADVAATGSPRGEAGPDSDFEPTSPAQSHASPTSEPSNNDDESDDPASPLNSTQSHNARSGRWIPWQDRLLIQEVEQHRPFEAERGDPTKDAWASLAVKLLQDSTTNGTPVDRTGAACLARFQKLLKAHNKDQTRSLQKTGTDEEVNQHIELMTQVADLFEARKSARGSKSDTARKKADVETIAANELRDSAMRGLVRREGLTDVASLEGASVREKQGQRKRRRTPDDDSDKENASDTGPKPKRRRNQLVEIVKSRNASDAKRLEQARKLDQDRHAETIALQQRSLNLQQNLVDGMGKLSDGLATLAQAQAQLTNFQFKRAEADDRLRYEDSERRRTDAERRAMEAERHASLLNAVSRNKSE